METVNVEQQYRNTMDSVNLIKKGKPSKLSDKDWEDIVDRNKEHIRVMLTRDFWTDDFDMTPFTDVLK